MNRVSLRERNKQRIRERILTVAFELFKSAGYQRTTMDEIAERAEISRGTLFNYFPTKDSLLDPFMQDILQTRIRPAVAVYLDEQHTTIQSLRFLFMSIHEQVLTIPQIDQAFKQEFLRARDIDADELSRSKNFLGLLGVILQHGQQRGEIRTEVSIERLARYIGILYVSIFYSMVMDLQPVSLDYSREVDEMLTFVESGLLQTAKTGS